MGGALEIIMSSLHVLPIENWRFVVPQSKVTIQIQIHKVITIGSIREGRLVKLDPRCLPNLFFSLVGS